MARQAFLLWGLLCVTLPAQAFEQVYLTPAAALKQVLPGAQSMEVRQVSLTPEKRRLLERHLGRKLTEDRVTFHLGRKGNQLTGYAVILEEIGKTEPITFAVGLTADLHVQDVAVMTYREKVGSEVRRSRFLGQFKGKSGDDRLSLNRDILPLTGATLSSAAITAGVKRALALTRVLLLETTP